MVETAIILAAGRGEKIWPYGDTWPKAALPIANRPVIQWQIDALRNCGIKEIIVVIGRLGAQVRQAAFGIPNIQFIEHRGAPGTANSLLTALTLVKSGEFAVLYGDVLFTPEDLKELFTAYAQNTQNTLLLQPLGLHSSQEWICADIEKNQISHIFGHPRAATHRLSGIAVLTSAIIPYLESNPGVMTSVEVGNMPSQEAELAESISQFIQNGGVVRFVEAKQFLVDIDKPWHLLDANTAQLTHMASTLKENHIAPGAQVSPDASIGGFITLGEGSIIGREVKIRGNLWVGKNTQIIDGAILGENTIIGDECMIREYCRIEAYSSVGDRCVVGHAAEFGGILMEGAYSYHYGEYWGVIGRSADLGAATVCGNLRFDDQLTIHHIKGRRELSHSPNANAAYLGDYTRTGVNAVLMPGVKVGPYSIIGPGVILNEDVPNNTLVYAKQELVKSPWGPEKYGW